MGRLVRAANAAVDAQGLAGSESGADLFFTNDDAAPGTTTAHWTHDAHGDVRLRVAEGVADAANDNGTGAGNTNSNGGTPSAPQVRYQHRDHLSSVALVTDEAGSIVEETGYGAWGRPYRPLTNARQFLGERYDADIGLAYLNARYHDVATGRFISPDTLDPTMPGVGTNRYAYALLDAFLRPAWRCAAAS